MENEIRSDGSDVVKPASNEFKFHGTIEEFKKHLPEIYEKYVKLEESNEKDS